MSKLDDILAPYEFYSNHPFKQEIKDLMLELIGEDPEGDSATEPGKCNLSCHAITERLTKREMRQRVEVL